MKLDELENTLLDQIEKLNGDSSHSQQKPVIDWI